MSHAIQDSVASITSVAAPLLGQRLKVEHDDDPEYESPRIYRKRRSSVGTFLCILTSIGLLTAVLTLFWSRGGHTLTVHTDVHMNPQDIHIIHETSKPAPTPEPEPEPEPKPEPTPEGLWKAQVSQWVNGDPTEKFQDNLRHDMQYVTTWVAGGWTNDFMTYINMIYLGMLSSRTPVIPPFVPSHLPRDAGFPPFGDVFDVPRLSAAINTPLLEWRDVKREDSAETDQVGCWSIWALTGNEDGPRYSTAPGHLKLDVAYTSLPQSTELLQPGGFWVPFWSLAQLGFPGRRAQALAEHPPQTPAPESGVQLEPDEQFMCFDFMYYIGAATNDEWWVEWSPAWRFVGQHTRWEPKLERLALDYVRRALGVEDDSEDPPLASYIGVHVRRGDITAACGNDPDCFQPLAAYARRVAEVSATLYATKGLSIPVHNVLVTSDETDPDWWAEVEALGWRWADHAVERTEELYGKWYAPLIDAVIQSMCVGFVGTDRSTMSLVAKRRVEDWHGGVGYLVRIGSKDADSYD